ncbi:hypothetical protein M3A49_32750 [Paraburkholderia sp. CNPSo 3076]|uniref:hypothetical protein n=1 Tax=Paraburkholderia sp. CNPSo 3076 TaxID=2940936 RepID=UPI0022593133|nr:hypothetical protein [Paraburkholderia sp. CNPSo 3076]MCX5544187.1 hypothetical protein [Paraburkholderia sp. CNPSo 3076]
MGYKTIETADGTDPESPQQMLSKIVETHTKLKISFDLGFEGPSVSFPKVDRNHPMLNAMRRQWTMSKDGLKIIKGAGSRGAGTVTIATGMVSGAFAEVEPTIYMPVDLLVDRGFSAEELASITLHEIGRVFVYFEFISRTATTNQVLAGIARALDTADTQKDRTVILLAAREALKLKDFAARSWRTALINGSSKPSSCRTLCARAARSWGVTSTTKTATSSSRNSTRRVMARGAIS